MGEVLILGAGTGGSIVANMLARRLDAAQWNLTVVDAASEHVYQPGLLFIPFRLYDYHDARDIVRDIRAPLPRGARFVQATVESIDPSLRTVQTSDGELSYDWLVCALGCRVAPEEVEGLASLLDRQVFTFYTLDGALKLQKALSSFESGHLVIDIADMPIKCPVAPIEFAFLADYYFEQRGVREQVEITLVTPYSGAFTKPVANRVLSKIAADKNIHVVPDFAIERVDGAGRTIRSFDGKEVHYDLLCIIPPNLGPAVLERAGLADASGFGFTDPRTLKSKQAERVYMLGDNTNVATSKAGSVAHFEAETVVDNLLREMAGEKPLASFDGHANCFIESGYHKALLLDFNYDAEPVEGQFPTPGFGPFSLLAESYMNHMGKIAFKWVYWYMLLPGYLPHVPMLPAHMNFVGKRVDQTPPMRHAQTAQVGDVMSREVVSVLKGASVRDVAQLMIDHRISSLPVLDPQGVLVGIVSKSDLLSALDIKPHSVARTVADWMPGGHHHKRMGTSVDDLMTVRPATVEEGASLQEAAEEMDRRQVHQLVVTGADGTVVGMIARSDLIRLFTLKV